MLKLKNSNENRSGLYIVKKGQTIKKISEFFSIPQHIIIIRNQLIKEVCEGDFLLLPKKEKNFLEYSVKETDSILSVCKKFSMQKEEFININGIDFVWPKMKAWVCK